MGCRKLILSIIFASLTLSFAEGKTGSSKISNNQKNTQATKKHYLSKSHYPQYYNDRHNPKSPKLHPTNPHSENFAD